jgi:hypothetical protein
VALRELSGRAGLYVYIPISVTRPFHHEARIFRDHSVSESSETIHSPSQCCGTHGVVCFKSCFDSHGPSPPSHYAQSLRVRLSHAAVTGRRLRLSQAWSAAGWAGGPLANEGLTSACFSQTPDNTLLVWHANNLTSTVALPGKQVDAAPSPQSFVQGLGFRVQRGVMPSCKHILADDVPSIPWIEDLLGARPSRRGRVHPEHGGRPVARPRH